MRRFLPIWASLLLIAAAAGALRAETVVATRTIRAHGIISAEDLALRPDTVAGTFSSLEGLVGQEAKVTLYMGRPIRRADVGPPALIERNQIVTLVYRAGGLTILAEGRALARAGVGTPVKAMNLSSRKIIRGRVSESGEIIVSRWQE